MDYPVKVERDDNGTMLVTFPDFPEAVSYGEDLEDALRHAQDALSTVIGAYIKDRRPIPLPSAVVAKYRVSVPALVSAKMELYDAMQGQRVTKAELARRLKWHGPQVDRLLEMTHGSKLDQIEAAFGALGKRLVVGVEDVAGSSQSSLRSARQMFSIPRSRAKGTRTTTTKAGARGGKKKSASARAPKLHKRAG